MLSTDALLLGFSTTWEGALRRFSQKFWDTISGQLPGMGFQPRLGDLVNRVKHAYTRRYFRHVFSDNDVAFVRIGDETYRILDISYGGLRIAIRNHEPLKPYFLNRKELKVELIWLVESSSCLMNVTSLNGEAAGLSFDPRSSFSLLFLNRYLNYMDAGVTIKALPKHNVRSSYQTPDWLSYGDSKGFVEVHLHMDMLQAHIYYVNGSRHDFVWFRPDRISVSCSPERDLSIKEKKEILSHVICLLLGMRQIGKTNRLDNYIRRGIEKLKRPGRAA